MAIRITCPGCKTSLTLDDDKRGHKVRCDNCDKALNIPAASGAKRESAMAAQNGQSVKVKTKAAPMPPPEFDEEEAPKKSKKKKKQQSGPGLVLGLVIGGVALFLLALGWGGWWVLANRKEAPPAPDELVVVAPPAEKKDERSGTRIIIPKREDGNPAKKGGTGIVNSVRGAGYRTERRAELKSLGTSYNQFCDEYKGGARTYENFLDYIKQQGPIYEAVKDGYYKINMKAKQSANSVIAYERDIDNQGYLAVKGDTSVDYVTADELKQALEN